MNVKTPLINSKTPAIFTPSSDFVAVCGRFNIVRLTVCIGIVGIVVILAIVAIVAMVGLSDSAALPYLARCMWCDKAQYYCMD